MKAPSTLLHRGFCSVVVTVLAVLLTQATAGAAPVRTPRSPGDSTSYDQLTAQIGKLERTYGGELAQLRDAQFGLRRAVAKANRLKADLTAARAVVAQLAASRYMNSGVDPEIAIFASGDPSGVIDGAALAAHLSQAKAERVRQIQTLAVEQDKARKNAQGKMAGIKRTIAKLQSQRTRIQKLIDKFKPSSQVIGATGLTGRMVQVRTEIDTRFGPFPVIGCLRPGDAQDHGFGRACDFMESTGGTMPTAARQQHGDQVAAWVIANASRLGVKYVIWRQRIYDMRSPGWEAMEDRGGITANHYDHVHVSVF